MAITYSVTKSQQPINVGALGGGGALNPANYPSHCYGTKTVGTAIVANLDSRTAEDIRFVRSGNMVNCFGRIRLDPISGGGTFTQVRIEVPFASTWAEPDEAVGLAIMLNSGSTTVAQIDTSTTDHVDIIFYATDTTNQWFYFNYTYEIV